MKRFHIFGLLIALVLLGPAARGASNVIEKQLEEIGSVPNQEVVVVERKFTRKSWRHEITPLEFGGNPFGTIRRMLMGGASYTLHANDWLGLELLNFTYTENFFSTFTSDINSSKLPGSNQANISPDYQKLLFFLTTGVQISPFYGKMSTLSRWLAYVEPFVSLGVGLAKTETDSYLAVAPGIGLRVFFKEWFSMKIEFKDYIYNENSLTLSANPTAQTTTRNNYSVLASLSFWLPKMP